MASASNVAIKTSAAGQYLGYSLQQTRLCHHLLQAHEGDMISLEIVDDTAIHRANGSLLLEQAKSGTSTNPVTDKSDQLWKTFANWADLCGQGVIDAKSTEFRLYVTPAKSGPLVQKMHSAATAAEARDVLQAVQALLDGGDGGCQPNLRRFLGHGEATCSNIIVRFQLVCENDPVDSIRAHFTVLPENIIDNFAAAAIGIARDIADDLIRSKEPAIIDPSSYRSRLRAFIRKHNFSNVLQPSIPEPSSEEVQGLVSADPVFVRQLTAIDASREMMVIAVSDLLRTTSDKIHWAADGAVYPDSFVELDRDLVRAHSLIRDEVEDVQSGDSEVRRGRSVYRRCIEISMKRKMQHSRGYNPGSLRLVRHRY